MTCPKCGSEDISVTFVQKSSKTNIKHKGCLFGIGRAFLDLVTLGFWRIFGGKKYTSKTKHKNQKRAVCSSCGFDWKVR